MAVQSSIELNTVEDLWNALEADVPPVFTTADLATCADMPRWLAQKAAWCFREMKHIEVCGKQGNSIEYRLKKRRTGRRREAA